MKLSNPSEIRALLERHGFEFQKKFGQNFLINEAIPKKIAEASRPDGIAECACLEIGPGIGVMTAELSKIYTKVCAVEIDKNLLPLLEETLSGLDNVEIVNSDILKLDIAETVKEKLGGLPCVVCANLPYYITTPVIMCLLESGFPFENITVMVQKEVADRICAKAGSKDYGAITLLCQYFTQPSIVVKVPAGSFMPPPKVDSAVLKLHVLDKPSVNVKDEKTLFKVIKASFAQRRKTLLNGISSGLSIPKDTAGELMLSAGIQPSIRGEKLTLEEFAALSDKIYEYNMKGI